MNIFLILLFTPFAILLQLTPLEKTTFEKFYTEYGKEFEHRDVLIYLGNRFNVGNDFEDFLLETRNIEFISIFDFLVHKDPSLKDLSSVQHITIRYIDHIWPIQRDDSDLESSLVNFCK